MTTIKIVSNISCCQILARNVLLSLKGLSLKMTLKEWRFEVSKYQTILSFQHDLEPLCPVCELFVSESIYSYGSGMPTLLVYLKQKQNALISNIISRISIFVHKSWLYMIVPYEQCITLGVERTCSKWLRLRLSDVFPVQVINKLVVYLDTALPQIPFVLLFIASICSTHSVTDNLFCH